MICKKITRIILSEEEVLEIFKKHLKLDANDWRLKARVTKWISYEKIDRIILTRREKKKTKE